MGTAENKKDLALLQSLDNESGVLLHVWSAFLYRPLIIRIVSGQ